MSIYDRRMFRMANGGMMPPDPAMAMGPAMMPPPMPGGMPPMPGGMPGQLPPELMMATEDLSAQAGENMVEEELMADIQQATDEGLEDIIALDLVHAFQESRISLVQYLAGIFPIFLRQGQIQCVVFHSLTPDFI